MEFELSESRAASPTTWAAIIPGPKVTTSGGTLKWQIQTVIPGDSLAGMEVRVAIESFSPFPTTRVQSGASFDVSHRLETREVSVRLDVPPGRYRLVLSVFSPERRLLAEQRPTIFVAPASKTE